MATHLIASGGQEGYRTSAVPMKGGGKVVSDFCGEPFG